MTQSNSYRCDRGVGDNLDTIDVFVSEMTMFDARVLFVVARSVFFINSCVSFALNLILLHSSDFSAFSSSVLFSVRDTAGGQSSTLSSERI